MSDESMRYLGSITIILAAAAQGECIGLLVLAGKRANIFGENEIALVESFRDQAVIAIENMRLFIR